MNVKKLKLVKRKTVKQNLKEDIVSIQNYNMKPTTDSRFSPKKAWKPLEMSSVLSATSTLGANSMLF